MATSYTRFLLSLPATAVLSTALILSGCAADETEGTNNAGGKTQTCTGKCDSTENAFRPLASLALVADTASEDSGSSADAGSTDAGFADVGVADAGSGDAGHASDDAGFADAGDTSSDAGSVDDPDADTSDEPASESFRLVAAISDEDADRVTGEEVLTARIWATTGETTSEEPVQVDLTYDVEQETFGSRAFDTTEIAGWDMLSIRVSGTFGEETFEQTFEFVAGETEGTEVLPDPFAAAKDVELAVITIDPELPAPDYSYPSTDSPFVLSGTEFWQKWPGGHNPTYSYSEGTEAGRKCMTASAIRFEAVMADPPESLVELEANSDWGGRFFNWNDDYSHEDSNGYPSGAVLWAWRTHLIKWISQTGNDGKCYLPTRSLVERAAASCLREAEQNDGEIQGCQGY